MESTADRDRGPGVKKTKNRGNGESENKPGERTLYFSDSFPSREHAHLTDIESLARLVAAGLQLINQLAHSRDSPFEYRHCAA